MLPLLLAVVTRRHRTKVVRLYREVANEASRCFYLGVLVARTAAEGVALGIVVLGVFLAWAVAV